MVARSRYDLTFLSLTLANRRYLGHATVLLDLSICWLTYQGNMND